MRHWLLPVLACLVGCAATSQPGGTSLRHALFEFSDGRSSEIYDFENGLFLMPGSHVVNGLRRCDSAGFTCFGAINTIIVPRDCSLIERARIGDVWGDERNQAVIVAINGDDIYLQAPVIHPEPILNQYSRGYVYNRASGLAAVWNSAGPLTDATDLLAARRNLTSTSTRLVCG